jgi:hypothetical protein
MLKRKIKIKDKSDGKNWIGEGGAGFSRIRWNSLGSLRILDAIGDLEGFLLSKGKIFNKMRKFQSLTM